MKNTPLHLLFALATAACLTTASAQIYIDEQFDYTLDEPLGSPWNVTGVGGTSTVDVETAVELNGYTPAGNMTYVSRPQTGAENPSPTATLSTGADSPATPNAWDITSGDQIQLTFDLYVDEFIQPSGNSGARILLMAGTGITFFGIEFEAGDGQGEFRVMETNSITSFSTLTVDDNPLTGLEDTWYQVTYTATVGDTSANNDIFYDLMIEQMGTGGEVIYTGSDLSLNYNGAITGDGQVQNRNFGVIEYGVANIHLMAIPEPGTVSLLGGALLFGAIALRRRRTQVRR